MPKVLNDVSPGCRVVIRYRRGPGAEGPPLTDVVGELLEQTESFVRLATSHGEAVVAVSDIVAARRVEASRAAILRLEAVAARGWRARETAEHEGWLLRADSGWTGRANSAIQLQSHDRPLDEHLRVIQDFYASRGLTPMISVPLPAREILDGELGRRGWTVRTPALVMTRPLVGPSGQISADGATATAEVSAEPSPEWLAAYHYRGGDLPPSAVELLSRHDRVRFAQIEVGGAVVAIARGAVDGHWLGLTAVEVHPDHRRHGHARELLRTLADWAVQEGATHCYLQTEQSNTAAVSLYSSAGFSEHHRYQYRVLER